MPKFKKLLLKGVPQYNGGICKDEIQWVLYIDSQEELLKYHSLDATLNMESFINMERHEDGTILTSHIGPVDTRTQSLTKYMAAKSMTVPDGEKWYPIIEIANITDQKYLGMSKLLEMGYPIRINEAGGYCDYDSYVKTWNAEVLEEVEKLTFGFPIEDEIIKADTIVLENGHIDYTGDLENRIKTEIQDHGDVKVIYSLREKDIDYVVKCIMGCKNVYISSQLQNDEQVDNFMKLFSQIPSKHLYLHIVGNNKSKLTNHPLFETNNKIHKIYFI